MAPSAASARSSRRARILADRAAVHAYLLDTYAYVQAVSEVAPAIVGAYEGAASRIAGECPNVLVGAPRESDATEGDLLAPSGTARERGEEKRQSVQLSDLEAELASQLDSSEGQPRRPAVMAFLAKLKVLPRGDPVLSRVVHADLIGLEEDLQVESTDVCADMKAWADSGYRTLSRASRALALKREVEIARFFTGLAIEAVSESTFTVAPSDRSLQRKISQLGLQTAKSIAPPVDSARKRVEAALGLTRRATSEERLKPTSHESTSSRKIGAGRTAAGIRYTVWLERTKGGPAGACKSSIEVRGASGAKPGVLELLSGAGSEVCLAPRDDRSEVPNVSCREGLLTIEAEVLPATRTVDLRMSNGTQIDSRPVPVSRRLGGPAAFYYQAVRGPAPVPVSLSEIDAQGHTLRVLKLRRIIGCSQHPLKYMTGGKRTLARGSTPEGPSFSIFGERYRLFGSTYTQLKLRTGGGLLSSDEGEEEVSSEGPKGSYPVLVKRSAPLDWEVTAGCHPHEYSIFYGLLRQTRDTVLAKVEGNLVPLSRARIPSSLHMGGVLVYLASVSRPEQVLVRSPNGKILTSEDLARAAKEGRETCEGESEGPGPPPGGFGETGETSRIVLSE
jgi:hypothetical protein